MASIVPAPGPPPTAYNEPVKVDEEIQLTPKELAAYKAQYRLGLPLANRLFLGSVFGAFTGLALGFSHGARTHGLRFRAENAHRLPTSQKGWYFYHKSKNYAAMLGGVKEGVKMGLRTGIWVGGFVWLEAACDHNRGYGGQQDFMSTVAAGLTTAALWSGWHRFEAATTVRTAKLGLKIGLGLGLLQDGLGYARGREITYIEYGKRLFGVGKKNSGED